MNRRATVRLVVAAVATLTGALLAVLAGLPESALLVAPWAAVLILGLANTERGQPITSVEVAADRVMIGDDVEVITAVSGVAGSVHVTCLPSEGFWQRNDERGMHRPVGTRDALVSNRAKVHCWLPASQWGAYDVGQVRIVVTEPYGLFRRGGMAGGSELVRVHPTPLELQKLVAPWLVRRVSGAHRSGAQGRGVEFADIRPFSSGDSPRDINWRASARQQELWVSQRHPDRATDVILLLDSFVESGHDAHTVVGFAIEAAVALAESHLALTDRVGLIDMGGIVRWVRPGTGRLQLQRLTDVMLSTGLFANSARRDLSGIPARVLPPRSFVVALTPLLDDRFIDTLSMLGGRGHDVAVIECASAGWDRSGDGATELLQVTRMFWEADRQVIRDRLVERGIAVARWQRGEPLEITLDELTRRRQRLVRTSRL